MCPNFKLRLIQFLVVAFILMQKVLLSSSKEASGEDKKE